MRVKFTGYVVVDEEALAEHDGEEEAPPNDVHEWYGGDLIAAIDKGIAEIEHDELEDVEVVPEVEA